MLKTIDNLVKKLKKTQRNGKTFHAHGLEEQILLKCQYYPKQSAHSVQSLSNSTSILHRARINNPKIYMEPQNILNSQSNVEMKPKLETSQSQTLACITKL